MLLFLNMFIKDGICYADNPKISHGVITWKDEEIDIAPEFVYEKAFPYNTKDVICVENPPE